MPRKAALAALTLAVSLLLAAAGMPFLVLAAACIVLAALRRPSTGSPQRAGPAPPSNAAPVAESALPELARALAEGTKARRATVWLAVGETLAATASWPPPRSTQERAGNLAVLLARPGIAHVVPVLDATSLRAALSIEKPELPVTPSDRVLMQDMAAGAALLLRTVALNAELADRVQQASRLAAELDVSRQRLAEARQTERRRLLGELTRATSGRLVTLRGHVAAARESWKVAGAEQAPLPAARAAEVPLPAARTAQAPLAAALIEVDRLLDRFRVIARGIHPAVLRSQGPGPALAEMIADLPRPVRLTGDLGLRVAWEIESAVYQVTAATLTLFSTCPDTTDGGPGDGFGGESSGVSTGNSARASLGASTGNSPRASSDDSPEASTSALSGIAIEVRLTHSGGRVQVVVRDPSPLVTALYARTVLVDDIERLVALGGNVSCPDSNDPGLNGAVPDDAATDVPAAREALLLTAWLPDRLEALIDAGPSS